MNIQNSKPQTNLCHIPCSPFSTLNQVLRHHQKAFRKETHAYQQDPMQCGASMSAMYAPAYIHSTALSPLYCYLLTWSSGGSLEGMGLFSEHLLMLK